MKINLNNSSSANKTDNWIDAGPQMLLAVVRQLVNEAHVQQKDILIYDARKYIPPYMLAKVWKEFSGVRFLQERPLAKDAAETACFRRLSPHRSGRLVPGHRRTPMDNTKTPS